MQKPSRFIILIGAFLLVSVLTCGVAAVDFYIAPDGNDAGDGTLDHPFASLEAARDAVRKLRKSLKADEPVTVWLRGGTYPLDKTFTLDAQDSGTEQHPVIYRSYGDEKVRIIGGRDFEPAQCEPVADPLILERLTPQARSKTLCLHLKRYGITDYGGFPDYFSGHFPSLEVFYGGRPMPLARWPNDGWASFKEEDIVDRGKNWHDQPPQGTPGIFTFQSNRLARWKNAQSPMLYGYFQYDWLDDGRKVLAIDVEKKQITIPNGPSYALGKGNSSPRRFYIFNLLEELDCPGEWYLDQGSGMLYFWPPEGVADAKITITMLNGPLVSAKNAKDIRWRDITFELTRQNAIDIADSTRIAIENCTLRNITGCAVAISGGTECGVVDCEIYHCGDGGIKLDGGDRKTLTPARHYARNNTIYDFSRLKRTYTPAVHLSGVGNIAAHNLMHDAPHSAILYWGNDHLMEFNEIHHVGLETSDAGAIYTGRDWTFRGNIVRYNFLHHNGVKFAPPITDPQGIVKEFAGGGEHGVHGIYLDDCHSSTLIHGNIVHGARHGVLLGGGRDNVITNNIMIECENGVALDARGLNWAAEQIQPGGDMDLYVKLNAVPYQNPPWSERYPELVTIIKYAPSVPIGNIVRNNVFYECDKSLYRGSDWQDSFSDIGVYYETRDDPGFRDVVKDNYQLRDDSPVYQKLPGFEKIPFDKIGPVKNP
jgi:parallel beta-helix repeat protein